MRNIITNGGFEFDQANEGDLVTVTYPNHTKYIADGMWMVANTENNGAVVTGQRKVNTGANEPPFSLKLTVTTPATAIIPNDRLRLHNQMGGEDGQSLFYGTTSARPSSISFKAKASHVGVYGFDIANFDGTRCLYNTFNISNPDTWQYFTVDNIPGCKDGVWPRGDSLWGYLVFWASMGNSYADSSSNPNVWRNAHIGGDSSFTNAILKATGGYLEIAEVMWVEGEKAIPYQHDPLEILRCEQRYKKSYDRGVKPGTSATAPSAYKGAGYQYFNVTGGATFNAVGLHERFDIPMAGDPVTTLFSPITGASGKLANFNGGDVDATVYTSGKKGFNFYTNGTVLTPLSVLWHYVADSRF